MPLRRLTVQPDFGGLPPTQSKDPFSPHSQVPGLGPSLQIWHCMTYRLTVMLFSARSFPFAIQGSTNLAAGAGCRCHGCDSSSNDEEGQTHAECCLQVRGEAEVVEWIAGASRLGASGGEHEYAVNQASCVGC